MCIRDSHKVTLNGKEYTPQQVSAMILQKLKADAEAYLGEPVTEITYEPWHWRYVGPENAALIQQSGLCFEDAVAVLQKLAAGEKICLLYTSVPVSLK